MLRPLLLILLGSLAFSACDVVEPDPPPVEPPPAVPAHPYGEGNGKVMFLSDLAAAQRIDVTLAGTPIGAVTKFVGCPSRVTADDSLATAIRPAGSYQYTAQSTTGITWPASSVRIDEDEITRFVLFGRPSRYANHFPTELEGYPTTAVDEFRLTLSPEIVYRIVVRRPTVVQGDRIDVVINGMVVARGLALGTTDTEIPVSLLPGPNWYALRLSHDPDGDGTTARFRFELGPSGGTATIYAPVASAWGGANVRYAC